MRPARVTRPPVERRAEPAEAAAISFVQQWVTDDLERRVLLLACWRERGHASAAQQMLNGAVVALCLAMAEGLTADP